MPQKVKNPGRHKKRQRDLRASGSTIVERIRNSIIDAQDVCRAAEKTKNNDLYLSALTMLKKCLNDLDNLADEKSAQLQQHHDNKKQMQVSCLIQLAQCSDMLGETQSVEGYLKRAAEDFNHPAAINNLIYFYNRSNRPKKHNPDEMFISDKSIKYLKQSLKHSDMPEDDKRNNLLLLCNFYLSRRLEANAIKIALEYEENISSKNDKNSNADFYIQLVNIFLANHVPANNELIIRLLKKLLEIDGNPIVSELVINVYLGLEKSDRERFSDECLREHLKLDECLRKHLKLIEENLKAPIQRNSAIQDLGLQSKILAFCYEIGIILPKDEFKAFKYYHRSANEGMVSAMSSIALMYQRGQGVKRDIKEAVNWHLQAIEQKYLKSYIDLAQIYIEDNEELSAETDLNILYQEAEKLLKEVIFNFDEQEQHSMESRKNVAKAQYLSAILILVKKDCMKISETETHSGIKSKMLIPSIDKFANLTVDEKQQITDLLSKAAANGLALAKQILANFYLFGILDGKPHIEEAEALFKELIDEDNNPVAMLRLASILLRANGSNCEQAQIKRLRGISLYRQASYLLGDDIQYHWGIIFTDTPIYKIVDDGVSESPNCSPNQSIQITPISIDASEIETDIVTLQLLKDSTNQENISKSILRKLKNRASYIKQNSDEIYSQAQLLKTILGVFREKIYQIEISSLIEVIYIVGASNIALSEECFREPIQIILLHLNISKLNFEQRVKLIYSISLLKAVSLSVEIIQPFLADINNLLMNENEIINQNIKNLSLLTYALVMIDCDLREHGLADKNTFISGKLIETIFDYLNQCCANKNDRNITPANDIDMTQIYRSYQYFRHFYPEWKLEESMTQKWPALNSLVELGEKYIRYQYLMGSGDQREVFQNLQQLDVKIEEEAFIGGYRVDFLVDGRLVVEYNGPSHFLYNSDGKPIGITSKEQVKLALLGKQEVKVRIIDYGEWHKIPVGTRVSWLQSHLKIGVTTALPAISSGNNRVEGSNNSVRKAPPSSYVAAVGQFGCRNKNQREESLPGNSEDFVPSRRTVPK